MIELPDPAHQPFVSPPEIAKMLDVSRQRVHQLIHQPGFPNPIDVVGRSLVWRREQIEQWIASR